MKKTIILIISYILIYFNLASESLTPFESLRRGYLLKNYPNEVQYDRNHTDSVSYYYDYFYHNIKPDDPKYGLGMFYYADYWFENKDFLKADSLFTIVLKIKHPIDYKDTSNNINFSFINDSETLLRFTYEILSEININLGNFGKALKCIKSAEKIPAFKGVICGNALMSRPSFLAYRKALCYIGLNKKEKALNLLLPHVFNKYFSDYPDLVKTTAKLLFNKYHYKTKEVVQDSFNGIKSEKVKEENYSRVNYFITINKIKIIIPPPDLMHENQETDYIKFLWQSDLFNNIKVEERKYLK